MEIDENLHRADLTAFERLIALGRREEILGEKGSGHSGVRIAILDQSR